MLSLPPEDSDWAPSMFREHDWELKGQNPKTRILLLRGLQSLLCNPDSQTTSKQSGLGQGLSEWVVKGLDGKGVLGVERMIIEANGSEMGGHRWRCRRVKVGSGSWRWELSCCLRRGWETPPNPSPAPHSHRCKHSPKQSSLLGSVASSPWI